MPAIHHIVFPFDFSKQGFLAARFVEQVAKRFDAKISLLSVVPPIWDIESMGMPAVPGADAHQMETALKMRLTATVFPEFEGLCVQRVTDLGDPAARIVEFAHTHSADLIMMPTHGCGFFRSLMIGSVTSKVLHDAKIPVWTATHAEEQNSRDAPRIILCAADGTPRSAEIMRWASEYAQRMGADLRVVHVVSPISDWLALSTERELQEQMRDEARAKLGDLKQTAGVTAPLRVAVGQIVDSLTEEARQEDADLMVIGRGLLQSALGRLRTHAYGIIQQSPCPVLSV